MSKARVKTAKAKSAPAPGPPQPSAFDPDEASADDLAALADAGREMLYWPTVLARTGDNLVGEILKNAGPFYEMEHYPKGDVYDNRSHAQYYYHAHRQGEHGHFHTFLRAAGMPKGVKAPPQSQAKYMKGGAKARLSHLIAVSMDDWGHPFRLFTTNRWVTAETWYRAEDVIAMLERFDIAIARPSWPANRWLTCLLRFYRPLIARLLRQRDAKIEAWRAAHPDRDVFEDKVMEVLSELPIHPVRDVALLERRLNGRDRCVR